MDALIRSHCERCGVEPRVLASPSRHGKYAEIRARMACEAIHFGIATLAEVAGQFNCSDSIPCPPFEGIVKIARSPIVN